jgi:DnaK suppressor protein
MTKEEKEELKTKIEAEAIKLNTQIETLKEEIKPIAPENAIGRLSRMDAINNRSVNEAALRKAQIRLNALNEAKSNINHPNFGVCANCEEDIPMGRLLLRPQSRSCVKCAH